MRHSQRGNLFQAVFVKTRGINGLLRAAEPRKSHFSKKFSKFSKVVTSTEIPVTPFRTNDFTVTLIPDSGLREVE